LKVESRKLEVGSWKLEVDNGAECGERCSFYINVLGVEAIAVATITRFEDIAAWKKSRALANQIYDVSDVGRFARDFALRDQMRRAAISAMSNIAEGFERGGDREFIQFLYYSKGSVGELRSQLYLALDREYVTAAQFKQLSDNALEISRMDAGLIDYLSNSKFRGSKYRPSDRNP
jgi:four helix bundle protein